MAPQVGVIMGSDSDWPVLEAAGAALDEFGVEYEVGVYSAHRTPQRMLDYATSAVARGIRVHAVKCAAEMLPLHDFLCTRFEDMKKTCAELLGGGEARVA